MNFQQLDIGSLFDGICCQMLTGVDRCDNWDGLSRSWLERTDEG